jgi:NADPH-dependent curcumin reductase
MFEVAHGFRRVERPNVRANVSEDIVDWLENAPAAFLGLLQGKNFGKMLVRIAR